MIMATSLLSMTDIECLDRQVQQLMDCKPLAENEIKQLCEKAKDVLTHASGVLRIFTDIASFLEVRAGVCVL